MRFTSFIFMAAASVLSAILFWGSLSYFKAQEVEKASALLTLYRSNLIAELQHFSHLPFVLSLDPVVIDTLAGGDAEVLDHRLARFAQSSGIDAVYLMDETGLTISASNAGANPTFKGQNYAFRPYFKEAQNGELGEFYGIGATSGQPGYFYAMPVQNPQADADGVIAIKIDLSTLQDSWQASGAQIVLANADGVALLASDPSWRYRTLQPLSPEQRARIVTSRQFASEPLAALDWSADRHDQSARINGERHLYLTTSDLPNSWSLHFFLPDEGAVTSAWLTTGAFMAILLMGFTVFQFRRVRLIVAALRRSETEEALLREANDKLAVEIEERRLAERNLQKTQAELERAGRLAALGQLASSVTHELGQPIAAMRNQLAAAEITSGATPLTTKMEGLVARMESITRQLKFFSRKGRDQFELVDLRAAMDNALELLDTSIIQCDATLRFARPDAPVHVFANRLRIEQVMTNVVRNALDAVETAPLRNVEIAMGQGPDRVWFTVSDTGHGLGGKSLEDLNEPFTTTRESGRGMGLGLTISAGIVSDHNGTISAIDQAKGGAVFRIELPRAEEGQTR